jgi:hypothetical protein
MGRNYYNGRPVTITVEGHTTYNALRTLSEIRDFAIDLKDATEEGIRVEGDSPNKVEEAVKAVLDNTRKNLPPGVQLDNDSGKPFLAMVLWEIQKWLYGCSIDSAIHCLTALNAIAPNAFEKARLLLLFQCNYHSDFTPLPTADWSIIGNAVLMLKQEKNGRTADATHLLQTLKDTGRYESLLGK